MAVLLPKGQHELRKVHPEDGSASGRQPFQRPGAASSKKLNIWTIIAEKTGVQATKERLKSFWTTLGVVSALMAALTYPAVTAPGVSRHDSSGGNVDEPLFMAYVLFNTISLILSFMVVILSVILLAEVDLIVTDDDLEAFINRYHNVFVLLTAIFGISIFTIISSLITSAFYNFNSTTAIASAAICIGGTVIVGIIAAWIALWTRSRLRVHISEANARLRVVVQKLLQKPLGGAASASASTSGSGSLAAAACSEATTSQVVGLRAAGPDTQPEKEQTLRLQPAL